MAPPSPAQLARERLGYYGYYVHGLKPARHHWQRISELMNESRKRLLIICPPGHAKSTWISQIWPCWYIGRHPEQNVAIVSNTSSQAELFLGVVKDTIEMNPRYREVFPHAVPNHGRGWSSSELFVARSDLTNKDPTLFATGVGGPLIGKRLHLAIVDDPLDEENTATENQRNRVNTWYRRTLMSRLLPEGRVVVILTRWHEADLAAKLMASGMYYVVHMKAIDDGGNALWPEMWPIEKLMEAKRELGANGEPRQGAALVSHCASGSRMIDEPTDPQEMLIPRLRCLSTASRNG